MPSETDSPATRLAGGSFAGQWTLDPAKTTVALKTKAMFGVVPVKGTFSEVSGSATVGADGAVSGIINIGAASLSTKMKKRDEHLRSADFFDAENHPHMTVDITGLSSDLAATGTLTVKGNSAPLTFPVTVVSATDTAVSITAEITVDRSEVGLGFKKMGATKMLNTLSVAAAFTRS